MKLIVPVSRCLPSRVTTPSTGNRSNPSDDDPQPPTARTPSASRQAILPPRGGNDSPPPPCHGCSVGVTRDDLPHRHGAERLPARECDRILEETDRAVAHRAIDPPRMAAPR